MYGMDQNNINDDSSENNTDKPPSLNSSSVDNCRTVQMPKTKTGLSSTEGDLIVMMKKYLEIVGLVFFVWLLGKSNGNLLSWFISVLCSKNKTKKFIHS